MAIPDIHKGRYFYHFTHLENLDSIIQHGLLSTNKKNELGISHVDIAAEGIQRRRSSMDVTCGPGGKVHDYVPFYFTSINPMLLSVINTKNRDQIFFVFIGLSIDKIEDKNTVFTDASANTLMPPSFFEDGEDLIKLDWKAIDNRKWSYPDENERHRKMAEVLIYKTVPLNKIDCLVVWNDYIKESVEEIFKKRNVKPPRIIEYKHDHRYFYFTKFEIGKSNYSLITGPVCLKMNFEETIKSINDKRSEQKGRTFSFKNIEDALKKIKANFCVIPELEGIYQLNTSNPIHDKCVSDHTLDVVSELKNGSYFENFDERDQNILELSAYLHDIGKGPKSKWPKEIQKPYPDHPADSVDMLQRILIEDFEELSKYEIRKICLLVIYHDLVGEILEKGRDFQQIVDIVRNEKELDMLIAINFADVSTINLLWKVTISSKLESFRKKVVDLTSLE